MLTLSIVVPSFQMYLLLIKKERICGHLLIKTTEVPRWETTSSEAIDLQHPLGVLCFGFLGLAWLFLGNKNVDLSVDDFQSTNATKGH